MRKAMIVWGGWPGHDPDLCASMIRGWLKAEGFEVRVETTTAAFADPAIHDLSLIIPIYTMSKIEKAEALNLCAAVPLKNVTSRVARERVKYTPAYTLGSAHR